MPPQLRPRRPTARLEDARKLLAKSDAPNKQIYILDRYAAGVVGNVGRRKNRFRGADCQGAFGERFQPGPAGWQPAPRGKSGSRRGRRRLQFDNRSRTRPSKRSRWTLRPPSRARAVKIAATLLNVSTVSQVRLIELLIDGAKAAGSPELALPPGGRVRHEFQFIFDRPGLHRGEVRLVGEDGSK